MKKIFVLFLVLVLLLSGCARQESPETKPKDPTGPSGTGQVDPTDPTEPEIPEDPAPDLGIYVADSQIERNTNGAVRRYEVPEDCYCVTTMGDGLLLFSGSDATILTLLREEQEPVTVTITDILYPDDLTSRVGPKGLSYHSHADNTVVFLDTELKEMDRIELPDDIRSTAVVTQDWSKIFYFDSDSLDYIDVKTGIARDLKECTYPSQEITGIHFDDTLLECYMVGDADIQTLYIDAQTGAMVSSMEATPLMTTEGQWYFASFFDAFQDQLLCGQRGEKTMQLFPKDAEDSFQGLASIQSALLMLETDMGCQLDLYDLSDGTRAAQVELPGLLRPWSVAEASDPLQLWFLSDTDELNDLALYRWDPTLSPTEDTENYLAPYYTELEPDTEGLAQIEERADALGEKYGVEILVYEEAASYAPDDFTFQLAYQVPLYEHYLPILDEILGCYPEGFLERLGKMSDDRKLTISLVSGAYGDNELGAVSEADGVQFMLDGNFYLTMVMNDRFEGTMYHEIFHVIDIYVFNNVSTYDDWDALNPEGFEYDNSYIDNQYRDDPQYLEDDTRYFIDMYSMSYGKEDRARIMEYAMQKDMESYFQSPNMQAKLELLCKGIRKAFKLKDYEGELLWEQYLTE